MKLAEALTLLGTVAPDAPPLPLHLVCGFTPLHLRTFLTAHAQELAPSRKVVVTTGLYGDCLGSLERLADPDRPVATTVIALEWSDFDPRLGLRSLGGWRPRDLKDILETVTAQARRLTAAVARLSGRAPVRLSLPTLPLPPVSYHRGVRASSFDLEVQALVRQFGAEAARSAGVALVNPQRLDLVSPPGQRLDVAADLASGFPYTLSHASGLGRLLAQLVLPAASKKGLITDLDDTLWRGLLGEVGPHKVNWDLDHKSQAHGLYQQMLVSLAEAGTLIAAASKNDPAVVAEVFEVRRDLSALQAHLFPTEVSWGPKSEAVGRILRTWNVSSDDVVFVDDSPLELAEVRAAWPTLTCLRFPKESSAGVYALLEQLRDLFGKDSVSADDSLRLDSLRRAGVFEEGASGAGNDADEFLSGLDAELSVRFGKETSNPRALELINKTNQFNLNGRRYTEGDWRAFLDDPGTWLVTVGYRDKFGPLGTIAAVAGRAGGRVLAESLVLSCRAFSRRIEHACLKLLFDRLGSAVIAFAFEPTPRNGPLRSFFAGFLGGEPGGPFDLSRWGFESVCPPLHHRIKEPGHD
jgi:FkbH-like protein